MAHIPVMFNVDDEDLLSCQQAFCFLSQSLPKGKKHRQEQRKREKCRKKQCRENFPFSENREWERTKWKWKFEIHTLYLWVEVLPAGKKNDTQILCKEWENFHFHILLLFYMM